MKFIFSVLMSCCILAAAHETPIVQSTFRPVQYIDSILPPQLTHYLRPPILLTKDIIVGAVHGFFNIDLANPLMPFYDGYNVIKGLIETYLLYKQNNDNFDIY